MARGAGGGVGERRGWLCSRSNGGRRGRSEGLERVTGRTRESPEREWNQYVEASACLWPHMRVSLLGETKHASIYEREEKGIGEGECPAPFFGPTLGARRICPLRVCDRVHSVM